MSHKTNYFIVIFLVAALFAIPGVSRADYQKSVLKIEWAGADKLISIEAVNTTIGKVLEMLREKGEAIGVSVKVGEVETRDEVVKKFKVKGSVRDVLGKLLGEGAAYLTFYDKKGSVSKVRIASKKGKDGELIVVNRFKNEKEYRDHFGLGAPKYEIKGKSEGRKVIFYRNNDWDDNKEFVCIYCNVYTSPNKRYVGILDYIDDTLVRIFYLYDEDGNLILKKETSLSKYKNYIESSEPFSVTPLVMISNDGKHYAIISSVYVKAPYIIQFFNNKGEMLKELKEPPLPRRPSKNEVAENPEIGRVYLEAVKKMQESRKNIEFNYRGTFKSQSSDGERIFFRGEKGKIMAVHKINGEREFIYKFPAEINIESIFEPTFLSEGKIYAPYKIKNKKDKKNPYSAHYFIFGKDGEIFKNKKKTISFRFYINKFDQSRYGTASDKIYKFSDGFEKIDWELNFKKKAFVWNVKFLKDKYMAFERVIENTETLIAEIFLVDLKNMKTYKYKYIKTGYSVGRDSVIEFADENFLKITFSDEIILLKIK